MIDAIRAVQAEVIMEDIRPVGRKGFMLLHLSVPFCFMSDVVNELPVPLRSVVGLLPR